MKLSNKSLDGISLVIIPLGLVSIYLIKSMPLALALLAVGLLIQMLLYRNYSKENRGKEFLKTKLGPMTMTSALILYFIIKYST